MVSVNKSELYSGAKCVTAVLVVIAHVTRMYTPDGAIEVANHSAFLAKLTQYLYSFHMPLFIMLSGAVYGYCIERGKYTNNLLFVCSKGKKLVIPYLFFGALYVAPVMCALGLKTEGYFRYVLHGILLSNDSRHLWYILALFWIFCIFQTLKPLLTKGKWELALAGCISLVMFVLARFMPGYCQINAALISELASSMCC